MGTIREGVCHWMHIALSWYSLSYIVCSCRVSGQSPQNIYIRVEKYRERLGWTRRWYKANTISLGRVVSLVVLKFALFFL